MELKEMESEIAELKQRAELTGQLKQVRRDLWKANHSNLFRSWESAKKDTSAGFSALGNFLIKINNCKEDKSKMEELEKQIDKKPIKPEPFFYEEEEYVKSCSDNYSIDMSLGPCELVI